MWETVYIVPEKSRTSNDELGHSNFGCVCNTVVISMTKNKDFISAMAIHTSLINSVWKSHMDWLKGFNFLVRLRAKTFQNSRTQDRLAM